MAWGEIYTLFTRHVVKKHPAKVEEIGKRLQVLLRDASVLLTMGELATIPEDQTWILDQIEKTMDTIMSIAGYDPEEDEEEEIDEEEKEDEEGEKIEEGDNSISEVKEIEPCPIVLSESD
jgi:hypothetical protein